MSSCDCIEVSIESVPKIMKRCKKRFEKYKDPCVHCRYKADKEGRYCIFTNCPRDWRKPYEITCR